MAALSELRGKYLARYHYRTGRAIACSDYERVRCRIKVRGSSSTTALDAVYDQAVYAANCEQLIKRRMRESEPARHRIGEPERVAYGSAEIERSDIYCGRRKLGRSSGSWPAGARRISPVQPRCSLPPGRNMSEFTPAVEGHRQDCGAAGRGALRHAARPYE
jgi:hypothetical protein